MYGPPPDPREIVAVVDDPMLWVAAIVLGLLVSAVALVPQLPAWARAWAFCQGQVIALTAPLATVSTELVYGSWPTIDKTGSLLFYQQGVHRAVTLDPMGAADNPMARLIGVHVGHLWLVEAFDVFVPTFAAFNLLGLTLPAFGWWAASLWVRRTSGSWVTAVLCGFPFGMGLHVFRDLNWYTIEKAAVGFLAVFAVLLWRAWEDGGRWRWLAAGAYALMAFMNWYLALVGAVAAALALLTDPRSKNLWAACVASAVAALPLVALQFSLLQGAQTVGDPETYLYGRAMLDNVGLFPPMWNRLEGWRALNVPLVLLGLWGFRTSRGRALALVAGVLLLLSLGPQLADGVWNPLYMGIRAVVPGFWRVAKPEVFFEGTYLCLLASAGMALRRPLPRWLYVPLVVGWLLVVRSHPVYPAFTEYQEWTLDPNWENHL